MQLGGSGGPSVGAVVAAGRGGGMPDILFRVVACQRDDGRRQARGQMEASEVSERGTLFSFVRRGKVHRRQDVKAARQGRAGQGCNCSSSSSSSMVRDKDTSTTQTHRTFRPLS